MAMSGTARRGESIMPVMFVRWSEKRLTRAG
jgi:hypothetical protein